MEDNEIGTIDICSELYNNDLDEVGFEPEKIEDADDDFANLFGY